MSKAADKAYADAARFFGQLGGASKSDRKREASRKNLEKARKTRWKQPRKRSA